MSPSAKPSGDSRFNVSPGRAALVLTAGILAIVVANVAAGLYQLVTKEQVPVLIDVAKESSIPTWYSSVLLALAGFLAALAGWAEKARGRGLVRYWQGLAMAMFYVSMDEVAQIHERIEDVMPAWLTDPFGEWITVHPWVVVGLPVALLFGVLYIPFLRALPARTRRWFLVAGMVFVAGALGGESLHGVVYVHVGGGVFTSLAILMEESLEMAGVVIFIYGLLDHLHRIEPGFAVDLG